MGVFNRLLVGGFSAPILERNDLADNGGTQNFEPPCAPSLNVADRERGSAVGASVRNGPLANDTQRAPSPAYGGCIAVIEPRLFLRECIRLGMRSKFTEEFELFSSVSEFELHPRSAFAHLIILSCSDSSDLQSDKGRANIERLFAFAPRAPIVVLASRQDAQLMRLALAMGVRGFIPMSMGFDLAVEAARFVLAGGTFVPAEFLAAPPATAPALGPPDRPAITAREMLVVRAIKQGKPNKVIAYELNMCESTVKVHVRHIMKKLDAKNRTAVAMKSDDLIGNLDRRC
jgi:DNA-binding NarL/FixJ family response regulator